MSDNAKRYKDIQPYVVEEINKVRLPKQTGVSGGGVGGTGGGASTHSLSGSSHTGTLSDSQAPQFLLTDGSRQLTGNLAVASLVTIDGVDISVHAATADAHHARLHSIIGSSDHSVAGSQYSVIGLSATNTLGVLPTTTQGHLDPNTILRSNVSGDLALNQLDLAAKLRTPLIETASGALTIAPTTDIILDPAGDDVFLNSATRIGTDNFASQLTGWRVDYNGGGDFRHLYIDELHAKSFIADLEQALAGGQIITKSVTLLAQPFTVPAPGGAATIIVKDLPSAENMQVFQSGDIIRLRQFSRASGSLSISDCWGVVTSYADGANPKEQSWTFTRSSAPNAGGMATSTVVAADAIILDYGVSGNGFHEINAIDGVYGANSPYSQVVTWTTHPATGQTLQMRLGNLAGVTDTSLSPSGYGLYSQNAFLRGKLRTAESLLSDDGLAITHLDIDDGGFAGDALIGWWADIDDAVAGGTPIFGLRSWTSTTADRDTATIEVNKQAASADAVLLLTNATSSIEVWNAGLININAPTSGVTLQGHLKPSTDITYDLGTASFRWRNIYADQLTVTTITGATLTGAEWEFAGSMTIDANHASDTTVSIANQGAGRVDLVVDRDITLGGAVDGVDVSTFKSAYDAHVANATIHHLSGMAADDHTQYLLVDGSRGMSGSLDMNLNNIVDVNILVAKNIEAYDTADFTIDIAGGSPAIIVANSQKVALGGGSATPSMTFEVRPATGQADLWVDGSTNAQLVIDRGATSNIASVNFRTAGADDWIAGTKVYRAGSDFQLGNATTEFVTLQVTTGQMGLSVTNPAATLSIARGSGADGTLAVFGTTHHSYFNLSTAEDTYIRGGKTGADIYLNDSHAGDVLLTGGGGVTYISNDADRITYIGRSAVGYGGGYADYAYFGHRDLAGSAGNASILQSNIGQTIINSSSGQSAFFRINNTDIWHYDTDEISPANTITVDIGAYNRKFRTLYAVELYVETLVAQEVMATIGGRIMVTPTTSLIADMTDSQTTIDVKHNNLHSGSGGSASGHYIVLQTAPGGIAQFEAMKIGDGVNPTSITGGWRYTVYRGTTNGLDGTPRNAWLSGDAVASLGGQIGQGYIDLTATNTIHNHIGPNMTIYTRTGTSLWNDVKPVVSLGNLDNWVDYGGTQFGLAIGNDLLLTPSTGFKGLTADTASGIRLFNVDINLYDGASLVTSLSDDNGLEFQDYAFGARDGKREIRWWKDIVAKTVNTSNAIYSVYVSGDAHSLSIDANINSTSEDAYISLSASNTAAVQNSSIAIHAGNGSSDPNVIRIFSDTITLGNTGSAILVQGDVSLNGNDITTIDSAGANILKARTSSGLRLEDDGGNLGLFVKDGANVGINTNDPGDPFEIKDAKMAFVSTATTNTENEGLYFWNGRTNTRYVSLVPYSGAGADAVGLRIYTSVTDGTSRLSVDIAPTGDTYFVGNVSALSFTDRTPYPETLEEAVAAILSHERISDYDRNNRERQLDHTALHPSVRSGEHRDLSATVSALVEVVKRYVLKEQDHGSRN